MERGSGRAKVTQVSGTVGVAGAENQGREHPWRIL